MEQSRMPLLEAVKTFETADPAYFRIPAHRFQRGVNPRFLEAVGEQVFRYDLSEAEGLDDLHHPEGAIREAEELAAELYGSDRCWFLVNGTTCGNEAMILSAAGPGEKIMVPRNAHKSVLMGLILSGARPVWIQPEYLEDWGLFGAVTPQAVEEGFRREPDCRAVFLVSPTYYGICSDIQAIAKICHRHRALLLVDEAHGSHLYFSEKFPQGALRQGADLCAQSTHKTAGSMTQSSMLHLRGPLADPDRVDENLKLVMSTSPSYLLMASLDAARCELALHGREMMDKTGELAALAEERLRKIPGIQVLEETSGALRFRKDPARLVFSARELGIGGYELQERLYREYGVSLELADYENAAAVVTWGNTREDILRLTEGAAKIAGEAGKTRRAPLVKKNFKMPKLPDMRLTPREAYFSRKRTVPWEEASGKTAGETAAPYPPGIPLIYPGEILEPEIWEMLDRCRKDGIVLHGPASPGLARYRVI